VIALIGCIALLVSVEDCDAAALVLGIRARRTWFRTPHACRTPSKPCAHLWMTSRCASTPARRRRSGDARHDRAAPLVRYDAYNELSGHQSLSIALLDEHQSGIVLSCIHHCDQARVYASR